MADFEKVYHKVIRNEGFYSNLSSDKGGETYMGVSRKYNPDWKGWDLIDEHKDKFGKVKHNKELLIPGLEDLVKQVYKEKYWKKMRGEQIKNDGVAISFFDFFINSEVGAAKSMQRALQRMGYNIEADGVIGPLTIKAINNIVTVGILNDIFIDERLQYYNEIVIRDSKQAVYLSGWKNRALRFQKLLA